MSYMPLARKYRPNTFSELVGQEGVALALANAIKLGREPHGLIFSGVRGIGKTTIARLYAKALNCEQGPSAESCNECASCKAITAGHHEDVLEIDGASNTGVDDVRMLKETIDYVPQRSKYKVYIIDEVHMLSQSAFNALLKTLEEPPAHVVFVFATTELNKVPQTILSRCQVFYLKKFPLAAIQQQLVKILEHENISFEPKALHVIATEAKGSMRDGLTLLDQAIALGDGQVTLASLEKVVSNLSSEPFLNLLKALVQRDGKAVLSVMDKLDHEGAEFDRVIEDVAKLCRHAMVIGSLGRNSLEMELLGLDEHDCNVLEEIGRNAAPFDLHRIFRTLTKCAGDLGGGNLDRFIMENYLLEWCFDPGLPRLDQLQSGQPGTTPPGGMAKPATPGTLSQPVPSTQLSQPVPSTQLSQPVATPTMGESSATREPEPAAPKSAFSLEAFRSQLKSHEAGNQPEAARPEPVAPEPVAPESTVQPQVAPQVPQPDGAAQPVAAEPVAVEPVAAEPVAVEPVAVEPVAAEPVAAEPVAAEPQVAPAVEPETATFPENWEALLDLWKKKKPLQARKLEEVHPLEYSPGLIKFAVSDQGLASAILLRTDEQQALRQQFEELFGFAGQLVIVPKEGELEERAGAVAEPAPLPESVLQKRERKEEQERQQIIADAKNDAFTQQVVEVLGGKIHDVRVRESSPETMR